ncbi:MAG: hypothetical protein LBE34_12830 [Flavobacteriaceae bacterium]|jgi:hypothetical protein|nr:hypothetical protein [Flavobacteriaceae bacterium]
MDLSYPYIENGKWKIFNKTIAEQTEADRILFDGFFSAIKRNVEFLEKEKCTNTLSKSLSDTVTEKMSPNSLFSQRPTKKQEKKPIYHKALKFIPRK